MPLCVVLFLAGQARLVLCVWQLSAVTHRRVLNCATGQDKATFTGMFDRGEIVEGNGAAGGEDHDERAWAQQVEIADRQIEDTEKIVRAYRKAGDEDKAQELEGWLDEAKQQLQAQVFECKAKRASMRTRTCTHART